MLNDPIRLLNKDVAQIKHDDEIRRDAFRLLQKLGLIAKTVPMPAMLLNRPRKISFENE